MEKIIITATIAGPIEEVMNYFSDLNAYSEVHPIIYFNQTIGSNKYLIKERALYILPISYKVDVNITKKTIRYFAQPVGILDLEIIYNFGSSKKLETQIEETISIEGFYLFRKFLAWYIKPIHLKLFENLKNKF